jgi:hypothetical protein
VRANLNAIIGHSLAATRLVNGFDFGIYGMVTERPEFQLRAFGPAMAISAVVMLAYLLFLDGGIFAVYLDDRKLSRAEFFESCGLYFWRMFRLALYSLIPFAVLAVIHNPISHYSGKLARDAAPERLGFYVQIGGMILIVLLALLVRLWFDLTQARVVRDNERSILRLLVRNFRTALSSGLYVKYLGVALFGIVCFAVGATIWFYLPHQAMFASFLVWELVVITSIATRLWMKATSARWVSLLPAEVLPAPQFVPEPVATETPAPETEPLANDLPSAPEPKPPASE